MVLRVISQVVALAHSGKVLGPAVFRLMVQVRHSQDNDRQLVPAQMLHLPPRFSGHCARIGVGCCGLVLLGPLVGATIRAMPSANAVLTRLASRVLALPAGAFFRGMA